MFRPAIVLYIRDPTSSDTGKQRLVRERPKKRRPTEVSVSYSGSPGAVGRHNNTPNRVAFDAGAVSTPHPVRALALRGARQKEWSWARRVQDVALAVRGLPRHCNLLRSGSDHQSHQ